MATVKQAKTVRRLMFNNHLKMYKMNENLAAKLEKGRRPTPPWSLAPKVPHFYMENPHSRTVSVGRGPF
jgi:hypothetical protein